MTITTLNRSYVPVTNELEEAIAEILKEQDETIDTKTVRLLLMMKHETWSIPERRVRKFVKRYRNLPEDDDSSVQSTSSSVMALISRRVGSYLLYRQNSSAPIDEHTPMDTSGPLATKRNRSSIPRTIVSDTKSSEMNPLLSPLVGGERVQPDEDALDMSVNVEPTVEENTKRTKNGGMYHDDNDKKKDGGLCKPCEGCAIL